jgi:sugar lactone lactonase YvrE
MRDVGIADLSKVVNLAGYSSMPASSGRPYGVALDAEARILYFSDNSAHVIRQLDLRDGQVTTLAGGGSPYHRGSTDGVGKNARFSAPAGLAFSPDKKYLDIVDRDNHAIRRMTVATRVVETWAGLPNSPGSSDGPRLPAYLDAPSVRFNKPNGVAVAADGTIYVADTGNNAIRVIAPDTEKGIGNVTTLIRHAEPVTERGSYPFSPDQIFLEGNYLYIADAGGDVLWKLDITTKTKSAVAGLYNQQGNLVTDPYAATSCPAVPSPTRTDCIYGEQARFAKMIGVTKVGNKIYTNDYSLYGNPTFNQ